MLPFSFFDEANNCINNVLVDYILNVGFCPVKGEKTHAFYGGIILRVPTCAVNDMGDLIEGKPFDVLDGRSATCAITSSPMKILSVILTGMDSSS